MKQFIFTLSTFVVFSFIISSCGQGKAERQAVVDKALANSQACMAASDSTDQDYQNAIVDCSLQFMRNAEYKQRIQKCDGSLVCVSEIMDEIKAKCQKVNEQMKTDRKATQKACIDKLREELSVK